MSRALDELIDIARSGMPKGVVGAKRATVNCGLCEQRLFGPTPKAATGLRICRVCNTWMHGCTNATESCYDVHMAGHMAGIVTRGMRKRAKTQQQAARAQRVIEAAKQKKDRSRACVPCLQPAAAAADPILDEFYTSRKVYVGEELEKRREVLRGDTSDEEGLGQTAYCTKCGSSDCFKLPDLCASQGRIEIAKYLHDGLLEDVAGTSLRYDLPLEQKGEISHRMILEVREELKLRQSRVLDRKAEKASTYAKRKDRLEGQTPLDVENLMAAEVTPGWESASRTIVAGAMNVGLKASYQKKMMNQAAGRGREFTAGSAADMLVIASASHSLERAIHLEKFEWKAE